MGKIKQLLDEQEEARKYNLQECHSGVMYEHYLDKLVGKRDGEILLVYNQIDFSHKLMTNEQYDDVPENIITASSNYKDEMLDFCDYKNIMYDDITNES